MPQSFGNLQLLTPPKLAREAFRLSVHQLLQSHPLVHAQQKHPVILISAPRFDCPWLTLLCRTLDPPSIPVGLSTKKKSSTTTTTVVDPLQLTQTFQTSAVQIQVWQSDILILTLYSSGRFVDSIRLPLPRDEADDGDGLMTRAKLWIQHGFYPGAAKHTNPAELVEFWVNALSIVAEVRLHRLASWARWDRPVCFLGAAFVPHSVYPLYLAIAPSKDEKQANSSVVPETREQVAMCISMLPNKSYELALPVGPHPQMKGAKNTPRVVVQCGGSALVEGSVIVQHIVLESPSLDRKAICEAPRDGSTFVWECVHFVPERVCLSLFPTTNFSHGSCLLDILVAVGIPEPERKVWDYSDEQEYNPAMKSQHQIRQKLKYVHQRDVITIQISNTDFLPYFLDANTSPVNSFFPSDPSKATHLISLFRLPTQQNLTEVLVSSAIWFQELFADYLLAPRDTGYKLELLGSNGKLQKQEFPSTEWKRSQQYIATLFSGDYIRVSIISSIGGCTLIKGSESWSVENSNFVSFCFWLKKEHNRALRSDGSMRTQKLHKTQTSEQQEDSYNEIRGAQFNRFELIADWMCSKLHIDHGFIHQLNWDPSINIRLTLYEASWPKEVSKGFPRIRGIGPALYLSSELFDMIEDQSRLDMISMPVGIGESLKLSLQKGFGVRHLELLCKDLIVSKAIIPNVGNK